MKKVRTQKGITLVALIITIIVLLILAVVAIRAVQGDGIISHAKNAASQYQQLSDKEESMLETYQKQMEQETYDYAGLTIDENTPGAVWGDGYEDAIYGDYTYRLLENKWTVVSLNDNSKTEYGELCGTILGKSVTDMYAIFSGTPIVKPPKIPISITNWWPEMFLDCEALTQAPIIPNGVTNLDLAFAGCSSLTQAPIIPNSVSSMYGTFANTSLTQAPIIPNSVTGLIGTFSYCSSLTQAPIIPNSVTIMDSTFAGCSSLTQASIIPNSVTEMIYTLLKGDIVINANPTDYDDCFNGTREEIWLTGSSTMLEILAGTSTAGNVKVK